MICAARRRAGSWQAGWAASLANVVWRAEACCAVLYQYFAVSIESRRVEVSAVLYRAVLRQSVLLCLVELFCDELCCAMLCQAVLCRAMLH